MTACKGITQAGTARHRRGRQIEDEVYRQMFRLEESRPGAEVGLALALLRAWVAADFQPESSEGREWLKKISPICLEMIETALQTDNTARPCVQ